MRILVTGSRYGCLDRHRDRIETCLLWVSLEREGPHVLVHGDNRGTDESEGVDAIADAIAVEWGWKIEVYPADWAAHGRYAGPKRNREMVQSGPDACLAFPVLGRSNTGTVGTIDLAWKAGIPTLIFPLNV